MKAFALFYDMHMVNGSYGFAMWWHDPPWSICCSGQSRSTVCPRRAPTNGLHAAALCAPVSGMTMHIKKQKYPILCSENI